MWEIFSPGGAVPRGYGMLPRQIIRIGNEFIRPLGERTADVFARAS